jgi:F-type H+-transporting ATPase subunit b
MLIDWFTVIAQIINFLILLFLLHRFLYKPILKTIDKRQDQMEARWQAAEDEKGKAQQAAAEHHRAQRDLEERREQILAEARSQAETIRHRELQQVREEVAQKRREWHSALENEQESILADLRGQFGEQIVAIVRRILQDIAGADLERQAVQTFQQQLQDLDEETRQHIANALAEHEQPVTVQSGHALPDDQREALRQSLRDAQLLNGQSLNFEVAPDLLFGIRLQTPDYDLAWDADDYLRDLANAMQQNAPAGRARQARPN